jgi:uncharacterized protein YbjT (DUF2867 family)
MKITLTGSLGNISKKIAEKLISQGHAVTIISRDPEKAALIEAMGARAAIGSIGDVPFLTESFRGSDAVYTMIPPNRNTADLEAEMKEAGSAYAAAITAAGVTHVVNLSGIGSHIATGNGPSSKFHFVEESLNKLQNVHVIHLQPAMFFTNFYGAIQLIRQQGVIGNNFDATTDLLLTHPADIAEAAAELLSTNSFEGKSIRYIVSDRRNGQELVQTLGAAIGKPDLKWVTFSDEQLLQGVMQNGFSQHMASNFVEMGQSIRQGQLYERYVSDGADISGKTSLSDFAREFAAVYGIAD